MVDGDKANFLPIFGAAIVVPQPGTLKGSGPATFNGKPLCIEGDESSVEVPGCMYMTPQYAIPGTGTLKIDKLAGDQVAQKTSTGGTSVMLKGSMFTAKFEVQSPRPATTARAWPADSGCLALVFGQRHVYDHQHQVSRVLRHLITAMSKTIENMSMRNRDGTCQVDRYQPALVPDYVSVDERSLADLLAFAHDYAKQLNYYDEGNKVQGDWSAFIESEDLPTYFAYARDPDTIPADKAHLFARPHFALYLSFLHLLGNAQAQLNGFTQRHLEFYYRQILRMTRKTAVPDRVNVLLQPTARFSEVEVREGHLLTAGRDSNGRDLYYKTDRRIVINHARIERVSTVYAERQVIGTRKAREDFTGTKARRLCEHA